MKGCRQHQHLTNPALGLQELHQCAAGFVRQMVLDRRQQAEAARGPATTTCLLDSLYLVPALDDVTAGSWWWEMLCRSTQQT